MTNRTEPTMTKPAAHAEPLPVQLVEAQALVYIVFAVAGLITVLCCFWVRSSAWGLLRVFLFFLCPVALATGMYMAVRRGRFAWFLLPNCATLFPLLSIGIERTRFSDVDVYPILVFTVLFVAPIILLSLPASRRWTKEESADCKKSHRGCLFAVSILWLLAIAGVFVGASSDGRSGSMAAQARELHKAMVDNMLSHETGGEWIDPSSCSNSTQFIEALLGKNETDGVKHANAWSIAINPPDDDDSFPIMISSNIDVAELLCPSDARNPIELTCPKKWGGDRFNGWREFVVIVRKGGASQIIKAKYATPYLIFNGRMPKLDPNTYFLTPAGRVDFSGHSKPRCTYMER